MVPVDAVEALERGVGRLLQRDAAIVIGIEHPPHRVGLHEECLVNAALEEG